MKTLVVGHVTHDHYEEGFVAGGSAFYGAQVHARQPGLSHLLTVVGDDFVCNDAIAQLDATVCRQGKTTVFANYYPPGQPRIQLLEASAPMVDPSLTPAAWADADLIHLAPVIGELDLAAWKGVKRRGLLAINVQGWIKAAGPEIDPSALEQAQRRGVGATAHRVVQKPWNVTTDELTGIDIACLSEEDIIGQGDLLDRLVLAVPIVALTLSARGSRIFVAGKAIEIGIYPTNVVDPTGAGDVFAATFVHHIMAGLAPADAARFAAAAASIVIEDVGARALERLGECEARAARVPVG
ncbi:MAG: sugar kinase [Bradymonadaceae bacterium]|nr:sugar kinase [Lujinxingiaceae bacterium]